MTPLFDTHAHYDDEKFDADRNEFLSSVTEPDETNPLGIAHILNCGSDMASSMRSVELACSFPFMYAAVGVHPHEASGFNEKTLSEITELTKLDCVKAIGEIGLDYHYDFSPRDIQKNVFEEQIKLSIKLGLPIVVHDREAHGDMMDILRRNKGAFGIIHSFSGSGEMAKELVKLGYYISYSGSLTFKGAVNLCESVSCVPNDRLLVETDSPYLAPVPYRGKRNDSKKMYETLKKLAGLKNMTPSEMAEITYANSLRVLGIKE